MIANRASVALVLGILAGCTQSPTAAPPPVSPSATASTSPTPVEEWHIAAAGDIACSVEQRARPSSRACAEKETSDLLVAQELDAVLTLGDNQYENGGLSDYRAVFDPTWGRVKDVLRPVPGNHEYGNNARGYFEYFGDAAGNPPGYYSYDIGPWHLVALNSNCAPAGGCGPSSPQVRWLRRDLRARPARCTLAYWHHPRFSSGLHGPEERMTPFWDALYEANADLVLSGHDHDYERFAPQDPMGRPDPARGIRQFVAGTGGRNLYAIGFGRANSQFRSSRSFGVLFLTLRAESYAWRFVAVGGKVVDSGTGRCH